MAFQKLKSILLKSRYGKIVNTLDEKQTIDMIKQEVLDEAIDLHVDKSFSLNK